MVIKRSVLIIIMLNAGEMGIHKDLSEFGKGKQQGDWVRVSLKMQGLWIVPSQQWFEEGQTTNQWQCVGCPRLIWSRMESFNHMVRTEVVWCEMVWTKTSLVQMISVKESVTFISPCARNSAYSTEYNKIHIVITYWETSYHWKPTITKQFTFQCQ